MSHRLRIIISFASLASFLMPLAASAQMMTTPYWCGSYYSSAPCGSYGSAFNNNYNYNYWPYYQNSYNYNYPYYQNYTYTYPAPSCTITASTPYNASNYWGNNYGGYNSYGQWGNYGGSYYQTVVLSWVSSNATSAYISPQGNPVSTSGSMTVYAQGNMTYTLTVSGPGGTNTCQTTYYRPTYYQQTYYQPQYNYYPYTNYQYPYWWAY